MNKKVHFTIIQEIERDDNTNEMRRDEARQDDETN